MAKCHLKGHSAGKMACPNHPALPHGLGWLTRAGHTQGLQCNIGGFFVVSVQNSILVIK